MLGSFGDITQAVLKSSHLPQEAFQGGLPGGPVVKSPPAIEGTGVWSLVWEDTARRVQLRRCITATAPALRAWESCTMLGLLRCEALHHKRKPMSSTEPQHSFKINES